jgi:hypothetical protein
MKIAVCIKQVPDSWAEKKMVGGLLDRANVDAVLNDLGFVCNWFSMARFLCIGFRQATTDRSSNSLLGEISQITGDIDEQHRRLKSAR